MSERGRDETIDRAKGILIFLVVLGHVIGMVRYVLAGGTFAFVNRFYTAIYLFHVPAFFFLAGCCWRRSGAFGPFVAKKARRLLLPYVTWGVASILVFLALRGFAGLVTDQAEAYAGLCLDGPWWRPFLSLVHAGGWPNGQGLIFNAVLWFLPVMFVATVVYGLIDRLKGKALFFVLFFALAEVVRFCGVSGLPLGLDRVPHYLSFMVLGGMVGARWKDWGGWLRTPAGIVLGWCGYLALAWLWPNLGYRGWYFEWSLFGFGMAVCGALLALQTAKLLAERGSARRFVAFGQASLTIMLAHKFLVLPVQVVFYRLVPKGGEGVVVGVAALAFSVVLAHGIAWAIEVVASSFSHH